MIILALLVKENKNAKELITIFTTSFEDQEGNILLCLKIHHSARTFIVTTIKRKTSWMNTTTRISWKQTVTIKCFWFWSYTTCVMIVSFSFCSKSYSWTILFHCQFSSIDNSWKLMLITVWKEKPYNTVQGICF